MLIELKNFNNKITLALLIFILFVSPLKYALILSLSFPRVNDDEPFFLSFLNWIEVTLPFVSVAEIRPNLVLKEMVFSIYSMLWKN